MASVEESINEISSVQDRIQTQQSAMGDVSSKLEKAGGEAVAVQGEIAGAAGEAAAAAASIEEVHGKTTALGYQTNAQEVNAAREQVEQARNVIHAAGEKVGDLASALRQVETDLGEANTQMSGAHTTLGEARTRLYALTLRAGVAASRSSAGSNTVGSHRSGVPGPAGKRPLRIPNNRHDLDRINERSAVKPKNTVILPHVDVQSDLDAIAQGKARWDSATGEYHVHGRVYKVKANGTVFPERGEGLVNMSQSEYKALQGVIAAGGDRAKISATLTRDPHITAADWNKAFTVFEQRTATERGSEGAS